MWPIRPTVPAFCRLRTFIGKVGGVQRESRASRSAARGPRQVFLSQSNAIFLHSVSIHRKDHLVILRRIRIVWSLGRQRRLVASTLTESECHMSDIDNFRMRVLISCTRRNQPGQCPAVRYIEQTLSARRHDLHLWLRVELYSRTEA